MYLEVKQSHRNSDVRGGHSLDGFLLSVLQAIGSGSSTSWLNHRMHNLSQGHYSELG